MANECRPVSGLAPHILRRPVGPNDFGAPEDQLMDITIPLRVPEGMVAVFRDNQTGELFDSDGTTLEPPRPDISQLPDSHRGRIRGVRLLGILARSKIDPADADFLACIQT